MYLEILLDEGISTLRSVVCTFHMFVVSSVVLVTPFVTGYSKTDHNVTFGQLLFIGSANNHTHILPCTVALMG